MRRRDFLSLGPACYLLPQLNFAQLDEGAEPIAEPHFPSRLHLFVWRNWELANADRMAEVIRTKPKVILDIGASMGLPAKPRLTDDQLARIYITVIRQNWHVLPQDQIIELLGWNRQRFNFTLKEDDFLVGKLGMKKPRCAELVYAPPSAAEKAGALRGSLGGLGLGVVRLGFFALAFEMKIEMLFGGFVAEFQRLVIDKLVDAVRGVRAGQRIYRRPFSGPAGQCRSGFVFDLSCPTKRERSSEK